MAKDLRLDGQAAEAHQEAAGWRGRYREPTRSICRVASRRSRRWHDRPRHMVGRLLPALLATTLLFAASPALALETSFHTYDGFAETVDAFRWCR